MAVLLSVSVMGMRGWADLDLKTSVLLGVYVTLARSLDVSVGSLKGEQE